ncbi:MAG: glycosyltransferase family 9 protein [Deferribacteraceae bacterium]|nr:glycosyltransferase family 9 protein [Deferribacteraceae bacterium]
MKKVLFIRFSSLGDTILTTGVIRKASELLPDAEFHILTYEEFVPVWQNLPFVTKIHPVKRKTGIAAFTAFLRKMPDFDMIFDLHASIRSAIAGFVIKGRVIVYDKQPLCRRLFVKFRVCRNKLKFHTVQRYAAAVFPALGFQTPPLEELRPYIPAKNITDDNKIVLHPFASKATKVWPYFAELARLLAADNRRVYIVGNGDFPLIDGVERVKTPEISEMFDVISDAALVITTDSGPMHAAVALNRKTVAVFGSATRELGFFPLFSGCEIVEKCNLPCRPCHVHGLSVCPKQNFNCMRMIGTQSVMKVIKGV